jgi:hypothetical protein
MSGELPAFYTNMHQLHHDRRESSGFLGRKRTDSTVTQGEVALYGRPRESPAGDTGKKFKYIYVRSRNVYENKQSHDKVPEKKRTFSTKFRTFSADRHEIWGISG